MHFVDSDRSKWFKLPGKSLKLVWGHPKWPVRTHGRGWLRPKLVLEDPKLAKNVLKWLKQQFYGSGWNKMVHIVWGKIKASVGTSNMTCLNPLEGIECPQNWFCRAQKCPKLVQSAPKWLKYRFEVPNGSKWFKSCGKRMSPGGLKIGQKRLKKQLCGIWWIKTVEIAWISSLTCLNPLEGVLMPSEWIQDCPIFFWQFWVPQDKFRVSQIHIFVPSGWIGCPLVGNVSQL